MFRRNITIVNIKRKRKKVFVNSGNETFIESLLSYVGQTITIFTLSGGKSGSGFTGVLLKVNKDHINLLTELGSSPSCSFNEHCKEDIEVNGSLGSITNIPIDKIIAFVHNTV